MATLAVQEAMGLKVDREAVATLVLPQLWSMAIGPRELQTLPYNLSSKIECICSHKHCAVQAFHGSDPQAERSR